MKILQWNIHAWTNEESVNSTKSILELISEIKPNLVSLNEVNEGYSDFLLYDIAQQLGYYYVFAPSLTYYLKGKKCRFGNAIFSTYFFSSVESFMLTPANFIYDGNEINEPRSVTWLKLFNNEHLSWFGSTHLPRTNQQIRVKTLQNLGETVPKTGEKIILAGDFNTEDTNMTQYFNEAAIVPYPQSVTYPCSNPTEAIDHFVLWNMQTYKCRVIKNYSSDHFPILLEL